MTSWTTGSWQGVDQVGSETVPRYVHSEFVPLCLPIITEELALESSRILSESNFDFPSLPFSYPHSTSV